MEEADCLVGGWTALNFQQSGRTQYYTPFVMGRKIFLFCNTPRSAHSFAVIYSIIVTVRENGLDLFRYLTWLLKTASNLNLQSITDVDKLLPINAPFD